MLFLEFGYFEMHIFVSKPIFSFSWVILKLLKGYLTHFKYPPDVLEQIDCSWFSWQESIMTYNSRSDFLLKLNYQKLQYWNFILKQNTWELNSWVVALSRFEHISQCFFSLASLGSRLRSFLWLSCVDWVSPYLGSSLAWQRLVGMLGMSIGRLTN